MPAKADDLRVHDESSVPPLGEVSRWVTQPGGGRVMLVMDEVMIAKLRRDYLSASTAEKMSSGCIAQWAGVKYMPDPPLDHFAPTTFGNHVHTAFENFYALDPGLRTEEALREAGKNEANAAFPDDADEAKRLFDAMWKHLKNIYKIEDPFNAKIAGNEVTLRTEVGGVPILGFIDRLDKGDETGEFIIRDYKGLAVDTPLPTPSGWTTMGDVAVGDELIGADGRPTRVIAKSEVKHIGCFRVGFDDGSSVVCDEEHLWETTTGHGPNAKTSVKPITEIATTIRSKYGQKQHRVRVAEPLQTPQAHLPVDPYILGYWLGNGRTRGGEITVGGPIGDGSADLPHVHAEFSRRWDGETRVRHDSRGLATVTLTKGDLRAEAPTKPLRTILIREGIAGNKHIPDAYLRASVQQRLDLLRGLMDSDGHYNSTRQCVVFMSCDRSLAESVRELVLTLGERVHLFEAHGTVNGKPVTSFHVRWTPRAFNPFSLPRKADPVVVSDTGRNARRVITSVERIESVPTQCVAVDSDDHLFLCGETMIPTHNTGKKKSAADLRKYGDHYADQLRIYKLAFEAQNPGSVVTGLELYWTINGTVAVKDVSDEACDKTLREFQESWATFNEMLDTGQAPTKGGPLCKWCPLMATCPVAGMRGWSAKDAQIDLPPIETLPVEAAPDSLAALDAVEAAPTVATEPRDPRRRDTKARRSPKTAPDTSAAAPATALDLEDDVATRTMTATKSQSRMPDPIMVEGRRKPWETKPASPREPLDPASLEAVALYSLTEIVVDAMAAQGIAAPPSFVKAMARLLGQIAWEANDLLTAEPGWEEAGNTRVRGAIFSALKMTPIPFYESPDAWADFKNTMIRRVHLISTTVADLHEEGLYDGDPLAVLGSLRRPKRTR